MGRNRMPERNNITDSKTAKTENPVLGKTPTTTL
jgi:hypothetical protein